MFQYTVCPNLALSQPTCILSYPSAFKNGSVLPTRFSSTHKLVPCCILALSWTHLASSCSCGKALPTSVGGMAAKCACSNVSTGDFETTVFVKPCARVPNETYLQICTIASIKAVGEEKRESPMGGVWRGTKLDRFRARPRLSGGDQRRSDASVPLILVVIVAGSGGELSFPS